MKNYLLFIIILIIFFLATGLGQLSKNDVVKNIDKGEKVPHIGNVEILNGCGIDGAAHKAADHLRKLDFDIKNIGNAKSWNYDSTIIVSRRDDMITAKRLGKALDLDKVILLTNNDYLYDVTLFLGSDFKKYFSNNDE